MGDSLHSCSGETCARSCPDSWWSATCGPRNRKCPWDGSPGLKGVTRSTSLQFTWLSSSSPLLFLAFILFYYDFTNYNLNIIMLTSLNQWVTASLTSRWTSGGLFLAWRSICKSPRNLGAWNGSSSRLHQTALRVTVLGYHASSDHHAFSGHHPTFKHN